MVRRIFRNLYFLTFLNGFLLASLFYFSIESSYENQLFKAIQANINQHISPQDARDSLFIKVMHSCNALLANRTPVFGTQPLDGIKAELHPATLDLMTAKGACGSYTVVLARLLENYDYDVRIAQMKAKGRFAAHNVVEVKTKDGWVVLDPTYDVYFVKPDGKTLANYTDVQKDWDYYSRQLPGNYDRRYKYEDVRYSNWTKIPIISPAIKKVLDLVVGKENADTISLRTFMLKTYDIYYYVILALFLPLFLYTLKRLIQTKVFPQPSIPFTFSNTVRYLKERLGNKQFESPVNS